MNDSEENTTVPATPGGTQRDSISVVPHGAFGGGESRAWEDKPGAMIGPYRLLARLGEGGFGIVWLAERREPMVQRVAIKIIKPGMDSAAIVARFEQERQAMAIMDHPNIARVFDAGIGASGRPYFVMEYIEGESITRYCDRHKLTTRQRLAVFAQVCDAVQHAHTKGLIHRDLKPSNILVGVRDEQAMPKVIDFGVAKALGRSGTEATIFTQLGVLMGTPEYMSPEQAEMGSTGVDQRADIYSLGVVLYELLVGAQPFDGEKLRSAAYAEIQRIIREEEPPRPSTRLSELARLSKGGTSPAGDGDVLARIAASRGVSTEVLVNELKRELEWIPLKAMRKDRTQRYATASDLARDVRAYLCGLPLEAGPESAVYRARKFVHRHRSGVIVSLTVVLMLVAGLVAVTVAFSRARAAELETRALLANEAGVRSFIERSFTAADPAESGRAGATVDEAVRYAAARAEVELADQPAMRAGVLQLAGRIFTQLGQPREAVEALTPALADLEKLYGARSLLASQARTALARAFAEQGDLDQAMVLCTVAISDLQAQGETSHNMLADAYEVMGGVLLARGEPAAAVEVMDKAAALLDTSAAGNDAHVLGVMANRAALKEATGDVAGAEADLRELSKRGLADRDRGSVLLNLAALLQRSRRFEEAKPIAVQAMQLLTSTDSIFHSTVIQSIQLLAVIEQELGEYDAALTRLKAVHARTMAGVQARQMSPAVGRVVTLSLANVCADVAWLATTPAERTTMAGEAATLIEMLPSLGHVPDAYSRILRARVALLQDEPERALREARGAIASADNAFLKAHAQSVAGEALIKMGKLEEAERLLRGAHEVLSATNSASHLRTRQSRQRIEALEADMRR